MTNPERLPTRRELLKLAAVGAASLQLPGQARAETNEIEPQRVTLVQLNSAKDLDANAAKAKAAIVQAIQEQARWILFPEMFLTGYTDKFDQSRLEKVLAELATLCRSGHVVGLIGTGWKEQGKCLNSVRIIDPESSTIGEYNKICLAHGDARYSPKECPLVHKLGGLKIGVVICNDLWVTPGSSTGPDPRLTWQEAQAGAQVIFHSISSGTSQVHRAYHESNHLLRAWEANCDIVAVNTFRPPEINVTSGVIGPDFHYRATLPRDREVVRTVTFVPKSPTAKATNRSPVPADAPAWRP
jgi:predicted amidohydrolase